MKLSTIVITAVGLFCLVGASVYTSEATTTFIQSTIVNIDQDQRTITFRTREGQSWTLSVADPSIMKKEHVSKGDQVSIEIDPDSRITKIVKLTEGDRVGQPPSP